MDTSRLITGELLAGVDLFAGLDLNARQAIADQCVGCDFSSADTVVGYKDTGNEVYFVISGEVEVSLFSVNGRRVTFLDKGPGDMVGELAAIDGQHRCAQVTAKTDCRMALIQPEDFMRVISLNPDVARRVMVRMASQVRELSERVFEFNALCVNSRIHVELLRLANEAKGVGERRLIEPAPTHADIASRVSSHREAVTREMGRLAKDGLLEKAKDSIVVTDTRRLAQLVEQSLGEVPVTC